MKSVFLAACLYVSLAMPAVGQISIGGGSGTQAFRVQGTMGLGNGESCITIANPNTTGQFLFLFPHVSQLKQGEELPLRLHAVGQKDGVVLLWKLDDATQSRQPVVAGGEHPSPASVLHSTVNMDIPAMLSGTSHVIRLDVPGIKAGSAISISPSEELPGMLAIAQASAPVDCVVIVKIINPGPFVPGMTVQCSIGAIGK
ncbi:MAG: hypothetical protein FGM32_05170 [Candidatus Kapabacteria bacterium]|nr:hypothetical protein [Candidatus Kapabacteria bacterium]